MWTEELPNGKFKYRENYKDPLTGKTNKVSITHVKNNKRVEKEMFILLQEKIKKKTTSSTHKLTLREASSEWLEVYKENVKLSSYSRVKFNIEGINNDLGNILIGNLKANQINQFFLKSLQNGRYTYNTVNQIKSNINRILKFVQTYKGIETQHISDNIDIPKLNVTEKNEYNYLERDELTIILQYFSKANKLEHMRLVALQANTGMRFGEMVSLDYKRDINFEDQSIHIQQTYDFSNNIFTSPKTGDERIIFFNNDISKLLRDQIQHTQLLTMSRGIEKTNTLLFKSIHGNVIQHRVLNDQFPLIDIEKDVTTHTLRHTFISLAVEKGINKELIAKQVGHSDTKMIDAIYSHFTKDMRKQQKEAMLDLKII